MPAPVVVKPIPPQEVNEGGTIETLDLSEYIQSDDQDLDLTFSAKQKNGQDLPKGIICTDDGTISGIPSSGTQGAYEILVTAENGLGSVQAEFVFTIKPSLLTASSEYMDQLKAQVWTALEQNIPAPNIEEMYNRPVSDLEIYYLMERWAMITMWDAFNLELPGPKQAITLEGASEHYYIYDCGSCLIACPKDLYSHERTLDDALRTAKALAREVYKRDWTVQMVGFEKLIRAAWVEIQLLGDQHGKRLEVIGYNPSLDDVNVYNKEAMNMKLNKMV
jgi:hypothetical protein